MDPLAAPCIPASRSPKSGFRRRCLSLDSTQKAVDIDQDLWRPQRPQPPAQHIPPTASDIDKIHHHIGLQTFGRELQKAANAIFPGDQISRYTKVDVILLSWEDEDPNLPVSREIEELARVFSDLYAYDVEKWLIPADDSHNKLQTRILDFLGPSDPRHLKIVYYAGHGGLSNRGLPIWTSKRNSRKERCPTVKWSGIQCTLEESRSDVLILLDCCASGVCTADEGNGVTELIAACAYNAIANGVGPYSFTAALNEKLRLLVKLPYFTIGYLYNAIFTEVQGWKIENRHKKAPVHLVLSQNQEMPRSIRLSRINRKDDAPDSNPALKTSVGTSSLSIQDSTGTSSSCVDAHLVPPEVSSTDSSVQTPPTSMTSQSQTQQYPRLLFSIRIEENVKPWDFSVEFFADWLRGIPVSANFVRVEAGFASDSSLLMVSMPASMLGYLPLGPAITLLGTIRSGNLLPAVQGLPVIEAENSLASKPEIELEPSLPQTPPITKTTHYRSNEEAELSEDSLSSGDEDDNVSSVHADAKDESIEIAAPPRPQSSEQFGQKRTREPDDRYSTTAYISSEGGYIFSTIKDSDSADMSAPDVAAVPGSLRGSIEEGGNRRPGSVGQTPEESAVKRFEQLANTGQTPQMSPPISPVQKIIRKSRSLGFKESLPPYTTWRQPPRVPLDTIVTENRGSFLHQSITPNQIKGKGEETLFSQKWSDFDSFSKNQLGFGSTSHKVPTGSSMCLVCQAIGRETWVLGGDTCRDCGTDC